MITPNMHLSIELKYEHISYKNLSENKDYILEFYFNNSTTVKFSSFVSWRVQVKSQKSHSGGKERERQRDKRVQDCISHNSQMNQIKVSSNDVTSSLNRAEISLNFCALEDFLATKAWFVALKLHV